MNARPILIIEDEHALGAAVSLLTRRMGHLPSIVASGRLGMDAMKKSGYAAVVLDIGLPDMSGLDLLARMRQDGDETPVLVITAHATLDHAIHSQKFGATAYLTKPLDLKQFEQTLRAMLEPSHLLRSPTEQTVETIRSTTLIGGSPCLKETFLGIARACSGDFPVLITGASGTGKTLAASVIHAHSKRSGEPLVHHACGQIQSAEVWEKMPRGSLVLDDITELRTDLQARLAAWLGDPKDGHARVIATTTQVSADTVLASQLREDLYYSLGTLQIPLPPLCQRSSDIPALCAFFVGLNGESKAPLITPPVMAALQAYSWPGNVRELRHVIGYALSMSHGGPIFISHLPPQIAADPHYHSGSGVASSELETVLGRWLDEQLGDVDESRLSYDQLMQQLEGQILKHLLERYDQRPTRLAAALQMHRATLRQKLRRIGLVRDED